MAVNMFNNAANDKTEFFVKILIYVYWFDILRPYWWKVNGTTKFFWVENIFVFLKEISVDNKTYSGNRSGSKGSPGE